MKTIDVLALILLIIGGLNWGLVGMFHFDLVATLFGMGTGITKAVYGLVGLSALYYVLFWQNIHCRCMSSGSSCKK